MITELKQKVELRCFIGKYSKYSDENNRYGFSGR